MASSDPAPTEQAASAERTANSNQISSSATNSSLVQAVAEAIGPRIEHAMERGELPYGEARASIRAVADWLDEQSGELWASSDVLHLEADR